MLLNLVIPCLQSADGLMNSAILPGDPAPLTAALAAEIARWGPITFARYMEQALYHPGWGYYATLAGRTGRSGDFFTSVSVGSVFGRLLGAWIAAVFDACGQPLEFVVVEQGAAQGDLAHDILSGLERDHPQIFPAVRYVCVEPLPLLQETQKTRLAAFAGKVSWRTRLSELGRTTGCFVSNELVDAFPVHLVKRTGDGWVERAVTYEDEAFRYCDVLCTELDLSPLPADPPDGYETELNPSAAAWVGEVALHLERGAVLTIDYGFSRSDFYADHRRTGTLRAFHDHRRYDDPLSFAPGSCDITSHVEFTGLAEAAQASGLTLGGFADQHHFLIALFKELLAQTGDEGCLTPAERRGFATLMHPEMMGSQFKAITFTQGIELPPWFVSIARLPL